VIVRLLLVLVGAAAYVGLAILGWGGFAAFFSHPPLVVLTIVIFVMTIVAFFAGGSVSPGVREDRANRWVLVVFTVVGLADGFVPAWTDRLGFWTLDADAVRWIGVAVCTAGLILRIWPVFVLGNRFSGLVAIQPGHTLVTTGIYGMIRHPSYLGLLLTVLGWGLAFRSIVGVLIGLLLVPVLIARINAEERLLRDEFGAEYDAYRTRTTRLIPGIY
jgi:protein-S-isoprenylcysteine O-methyltransferase Ste14